MAGCAQSSGTGAPGSGTPVPVATKTVYITVSPVATPVSSPAPTARPSPAMSPSPGRGEWKAVACTNYSTLALRRDGTLWSWGLNDYGQLGRGTAGVNAHPIPREVGHSRSWVAVSGGWGDAFALREDGTLWAWGNNSEWGGNLGLGKDLEYYDVWSPMKVGSTRTWTAVSTGWEHGLALREDGSLWTWGANLNGALGSGDTTWTSAPGRVGAGADWTAVAGGGEFSLALRKGGTLWAWGANAYGNLGLGDATDRHSPTQVGGDRDWAAVSAGIGDSLALKRDGTLWAWGDNGFGQLGVGDIAERHAPTQVGEAHDWAAIACLGHHNVALKRDGTMWAWGENSFGQLGLGDTTDRRVPAQVGTDDDWAAIAPGSAGSYHTLAIKRGGTLWAWGLNRFGQLGLGDTTDRHVPTRVGAR
jgi:alpha-tubulin suppressor-like RCC1 family protein